MIKRLNNGKIVVDTLSLTVLFDDMFEQCKNEKEMIYVGRCIVESLDEACCDCRSEDIAPNLSLAEVLDDLYYN